MKIEPVSRRNMHYNEPVKTPCQLVREIYNSIDNEEAKVKCRIVTRMMKMMAEKIGQYEPEWNNIWRGSK